MPAAATIQVTAGSLPIASSFADISTHPPTINEITTDLVAKPGNVGVIKGLLHNPLLCKEGCMSNPDLCHTQMPDFLTCSQVSCCKSQQLCLWGAHR